MGWRDLCFGAVSGALLSLSRPPAGLTLEEWVTPSGVRQGLWRAGALTIIAAALLFKPRSVASERASAIQLAVGAALGFALHGFVLVDIFPEGTQAAWLVATALAFVVLLALRKREPLENASGAQGSWPILFRFSMALAGAGLASVLSALNSRASLLGGGTRDDDTTFASVALALLAIAALAFGPLLRSRKLNPCVFPLGLALAAVLALFSFDFLAALSTPKGYDELLAQFGLNSGLRGTLAYDALIAARVFGLPCLCAGIAFACVQQHKEIACALLGAAAASVLGVHARNFDADAMLQVASSASRHAEQGAVLAAVGALCAAIATPIRRREWIGHAAVSSACLIYALSNNNRAALPLSPWEQLPVRIEWMRETPEGLLTIERQAKRGLIVTLDRRRLTPTMEELEADARRLSRSFEGQGTNRAAVLAGILTPERAHTLRSLGIDRWFVATPWPELQLELEAKLFEIAGEPTPTERAAADDRSWKSTATSKDLRGIVAPPVEVTARASNGLRTDHEPTLPRIGWLYTHQEIANLDWSEKVLVSCTHLDDFSIGIVSGPLGERSGLPSGDRLASRAWQRLARVDSTQREFEARTRAAARLLRAAPNPVTGALHRLCEAQRPSSPYETRALRTEMDPTAINLLRDSALAAAPRGFERELDEFVATTLEEKRDLEGLAAFAQPLADAHPTWTRLQRAAASADWEFMEWTQAAARLEKIVESTPADLQARLWLAEALLRADQASAALRVADELLVIAPGSFEAQKLRAIAAVRCGDSRGAEWLATLLREHAGDPQLTPYTQPGPLPPLWPSLGIPGQSVPESDHP